MLKKPKICGHKPMKSANLPVRSNCHITLTVPATVNGWKQSPTRFVKTSQLKLNQIRVPPSPNSVSSSPTVNWILPSVPAGSLITHRFTTTWAQSLEPEHALTTAITTTLISISYCAKQLPLKTKLPAQSTLQQRRPS